jgi:hydrogenase nickel incorporation protein HypA/HybF
VHELGITRNIVAIVTEAAQGRRVLRIMLEVGKLSGVMADAIAFCFDVVATNAGLDGTKLDITEIEGYARCVVCGAEFPAPTLFTACVCGSRRIVLLKGEELKVKFMELEEMA